MCRVSFGLWWPLFVVCHLLVPSPLAIPVRLDNRRCLNKSVAVAKGADRWTRARVMPPAYPAFPDVLSKQRLSACLVAQQQRCFYQQPAAVNLALHYWLLRSNCPGVLEQLICAPPITHDPVQVGYVNRRSQRKACRRMVVTK